MRTQKHDGCRDCGSKDQAVLKSVLVKGEKMGSALCDKCIAERQQKGELV